MTTFPHSVGLWRNDAHEYWWADGTGSVIGPLTSVTTALKALDKPALVQWAKNETAACAVRNLDMLTRMIESGGPESAAKWLAATPDHKRDTASDLGTRIHTLAEQRATSPEVTVTEEEAPFVTQYGRFLDDFTPTFIRVEAKVCNLTHTYAGTLDALAVIDGLVTLFDIKTGKGIYPETALQLAGLGFAEFIGWPDDPKQYPMPHIDRYAVLHLRPDGYRLVPYDVTAETFARFLETKRLYEWLKGTAKKVMGTPIQAAIAEAA